MYDLPCAVSLKTYPWLQRLRHLLQLTREVFEIKETGASAR